MPHGAPGAQEVLPEAGGAEEATSIIMISIIIIIIVVVVVVVVVAVTFIPTPAPTPAKRTSANLMPYPHLPRRCSTNCIGYGHGMGVNVTAQVRPVLPRRQTT